MIPSAEAEEHRLRQVQGLRQPSLNLFTLGNILDRPEDPGNLAATGHA